MQRIPLFVLPTVLFPGAILPLHVFEPRYRQMAAKCLETDRRFGVLYHDSEAGSFELADGAVGCVAEILEFKPLPDGRSLMATRGVERYRVMDGVESDTLYTEAVVEPWPDTSSEDNEWIARITARRYRSAELFAEAASRAGRPSDSLPRMDPAHDVSWQIAQAFRIAESWRQALLEMRSELDRLDEIDRLLRVVIESEIDQPGGS